MLPPIPNDWQALLRDEVHAPYYRALDTFLDAEAAAGQTILPPRADIFNALKFTSYAQVKVLLLGQDPYPTPGNAHGLCFSVKPDVTPIPASLKNIYKELHADVGFRIPNHGYLEPWAKQGMLMLNTVLTVRAHEANSHQKQGWEKFTDRIIQLVAAKPTRVVFLLLGNSAKAKQELITPPHHTVIACAHPSPLSFRKFTGCRCFSKVNAALAAAGLEPIDWTLPDVGKGQGDLLL